MLPSAGTRLATAGVGLYVGNNGGGVCVCVCVCVCELWT